MICVLFIKLIIENVLKFRGLSEMKNKLLAALIAASTLAISNSHAEVKVTTKGGLKVTSGDYEFKFGGRIQYDYNRAEENGVVDEDQFDIRRARVFASGNIAKNWTFKTQFNTDGGGVEDLYLRYTGFGKGANVTIGNQKQPFGLEELTSSKDISVLERSAFTELFAIGRAEGVQLHGNLAKNATYAVSAFFDDVDDSEAGEEFGVAARVTWAPVKTDTSVVHLGAAVYDNDETDAFGIEAALTSGPFHVQAEWADGSPGAGDSSDGFYIQAGYVLTGETRPYSGGKFKRVAPASNGGAWEVVARLEEGAGNFSDIELGTTEASAVVLGLNWYAHKNVRFGVSYTDGDDDFSDDSGEEIRVRFQLTF